MSNWPPNALPPFHEFRQFELPDPEPVCSHYPGQPVLQKCCLDCRQDRAWNETLTARELYVALIEAGCMPVDKSARALLEYVRQLRFPPIQPDENSVAVALSRRSLDLVVRSLRAMIWLLEKNVEEVRKHAPSVALKLQTELAEPRRLADSLQWGSGGKKGTAPCLICGHLGIEHDQSNNCPFSL